MSINQSDKTIQFIKQVKELKDTGKINKYVEIIDALEWDKTSLSNVMNGRMNIPDWVYIKFREVYGIRIEDPGRESMETIMRLDAKCTVLLAAIAEILAIQKGQTAAKIGSELTELVNSQLKLKMGI